MTESNNWEPKWLSRGNRTRLLIFASCNNNRIGHGRYRVFVGIPAAEGETTTRLPECKVITVTDNRNGRPVPTFTVKLQDGREVRVDPIEDCEKLELKDYDFEQGMLSVTITKK